MQKTILITGGAGYIGSHAVVAFELSGYKTVIIDNFVNSDETNLDGIKKILGYSPDFFECDISDEKKLEKIFEKYNFDAVVHFAGLKSPDESLKNPLLYYKNNISGSLVLFHVMSKYGVKKILFSSSANIYHKNNTSPIVEDMLLGPNNPYGATKLYLEKILEELANSDGWSVINLRYFNPIGAHESGFIGEKPNGVPNNLLPYVLDVALGKREKVLVFGGDYATADGTGVRDYIDVNDLVDAHLLAYEHLEKWVKVYNVGTGQGTSVLEMISLVEKISEKNISYEIVARRPWDLGEVFASAQKIKTELGWTAKRTISDAISSGWKFVKNNL